MIVIHNLVTGYYGCGVSPSISGYIMKGSMLTITGANGVGKSTVLKTLAGLLPPTSGKLEFKSVGRAKIIGYLPQIKNMDYCFPITVFDVVSMGCYPSTSFFKKFNHYQKRLIWRALEEVGLENLLNKYIDSLSGGQFQRMLFARILVQNASLILLDEPFQGIDQKTCEILVRSINQLHKNGCTIIISLHDCQFVSKCFVNQTLLLTQSSSIWKSLN